MFSTKYAKQNHSKLAHDPEAPEAKKVRCPLCQKEVTSHYLKTHLKTHSATKKTFACDQCDSVFTRNYRYDTCGWLLFPLTLLYSQLTHKSTLS